METETSKLKRLNCDHLTNMLVTIGPKFRFPWVKFVQQDQGNFCEARSTSVCWDIFWWGLAGYTNTLLPGIFLWSFASNLYGWHPIRGFLCQHCTYMRVVPLSNFQRVNTSLLPDLLSDILDRKRRTQIHQSSTVDHACVRWKEHPDRHSWRGLRCIYKRVMMIKQKDNKNKNNKEEEWERRKGREKWRLANRGF